jgi:hypothetical protein
LLVNLTYSHLASDSSLSPIHIKCINKKAIAALNDSNSSIRLDLLGIQLHHGSKQSTAQNKTIQINQEVTMANITIENMLTHNTCESDSFLVKIDDELMMSVIGGGGCVTSTETKMTEDKNGNIVTTTVVTTVCTK